METPDNLRTYQVDLTMHHLGRAVELYFQSTSFVKRVQPWDWILEGRNAFSSIIHAYCGLESAINGIGYELFFNTDSSIYIPPERRDFPLARMIDAWHGRMQSVDKLKFILAHEANAEITQPLAAEVQEVNNLRNWIVHGFSFKRTVLLEPKQEEEGVFTEVDREDTVSWEAKFPRLKFNSLDELDAEDAVVRPLSGFIIHVYQGTPQPCDCLRPAASAPSGSPRARRSARSRAASVNRTGIMPSAAAAATFRSQSSM